MDDLCVKADTDATECRFEIVIEETCPGGRISIGAADLLEEALDDLCLPSRLAIRELLA